MSPVGLEALGSASTSRDSAWAPSTEGLLRRGCAAILFVRSSSSCRDGSTGLSKYEMDSFRSSNGAAGDPARPLARQAAGTVDRCAAPWILGTGIAPAAPGRSIAVRAIETAL